VKADRAIANAKARESWRDRSLSFGWHAAPLTGPPDWLANCFKPEARISASRPWWAIPDFDPEIGDIKTVWEASRLDWLIAMSQRAAKGDAAELDRLNEWLQDWLEANPPYCGPNWKCGQEASFRVMHLALAALILGRVKEPSPNLIQLVQLHLDRIAPTMAYAIGQQNNHGTSEAAALFIGGTWLEHIGVADGARFSRLGRRWLEKLALALIEPDGTFSQYSVVYHRVLLDTYSIVEVWRRQFNSPTFSGRLYTRLTAAVHWLHGVTDAETGAAPNLGNNDGARIIALTDTDYRDFRPSLQLAAALLTGARAWPADGDWNQPLTWLRVVPPLSCLPEPVSRSHDYGGVHILRNNRVRAIMRYSRYRFRPHQADALHLDVWLDGINILRDGGTYSYSISEADIAYFGGAKSHNLVEVDGRDQMPRISRFLFGSWLRARNVQTVQRVGECVTAAAGYKDAWGATVDRKVTLDASGLLCADTVGGQGRRAILRWRLAPGQWAFENGVLSNGSTSLEVSCSRPISRLELVEGEESIYYLNRSSLPVLEIESDVPCTFTTIIRF
jgi:hypothetical protein